jgi:hypothetical protein
MVAGLDQLRRELAGNQRGTSRALVGLSERPAHSRRPLSQATCTHSNGFMTQRTRITVLAALAALTIGCDREARARAADTTTTVAASAGVVDSIFPPEEALRRFREPLPMVSALDGAMPSRDSLVRRFVRAIEARDTSALRSIVMTRAEFAHLYFETSPHARPPAQQPPALVWFLHTQNSVKGVSRALDRFGGRPLGFRGYTCAPAPRVEGANTVWDDCLLHLGSGRDTTSIRLFGGVIERDGRFKLLSYSNDL